MSDWSGRSTMSSNVRLTLSDIDWLPPRQQQLRVDAFGAVLQYQLEQLHAAVDERRQRQRAGSERQRHDDAGGEGLLLESLRGLRREPVDDGRIAEIVGAAEPVARVD